MNEDRIWTALVTFERTSTAQDVLPDWAQGAAGYLAALAPDEEAALSLLRADFESAHLRVLEISELREIYHADELDELDEHLADNFRRIEEQKSTVWGTIHCYMADGEA